MESPREGQPIGQPGRLERSRVDGHEHAKSAFELGKRRTQPKAGSFCRGITAQGQAVTRRGPIHHAIDKKGWAARVKRILLADDHALVRKGLEETLEEEFGRITFGEAENSQQVLDLAWNEKWDLVILDINMGGRSGLETLEELRKAHPKLPVLVLSMYPVAEFAVRALKLGAAGYVSKQSASDELVAAVKAVLNGARYIRLGPGRAPGR